MQWRFWRDRQRQEEDLARELQTHLDCETEDRQQAGLPAAEARWAARRTLEAVRDSG